MYAVRERKPRFYLNMAVYTLASRDPYLGQGAALMTRRLFRNRLQETHTYIDLNARLPR